MLTKALILAINRKSNRCTIRIPLFESVASLAPVVVEAPLNISPGIYNGLVEGDAVYVGFEENRVDKPIILGKLYKGAANEGSRATSAIIGKSLEISDSAIIPLGTQIRLPEVDSNPYIEYNTIEKLIKKLKRLDDLQKDTSRKESYITLVCAKNKESVYYFTLNTSKAYGSDKNQTIEGSDIFNFFSDVYNEAKKTLPIGIPITRFIWGKAIPKEFLPSYGSVVGKDINTISLLGNSLEEPKLELRDSDIQYIRSTLINK